MGHSPTPAQLHAYVDHCCATEHVEHSKYNGQANKHPDYTTDLFAKRVADGRTQRKPNTDTDFQTELTAFTTAQPTAKRSAHWCSKRPTNRVPQSESICTADCRSDSIANKCANFFSEFCFADN